MSNIVKLFKESNQEYLSTAYLLSNSDDSVEDIYEEIHSMLELKTIQKFEFVICPLCASETKVESSLSEYIKCLNCNEFIIPDFVIERFKITDKEDKLRLKQD
ncbi:TPA: hypothetical protein KOR49_002228 [Clostridioides difficile]|uniref:Uncharacterized protein n=1 Tax=Clostridioides difficile TaxID=1496 RepID=A0AAN5VQL8_CLODI|nr:hypothetical protein [Clostridioides difficile]EGT3944782.1 hypothetical protein [Clostridioides difficile]MBG0197899.1 hypothetical protein [Clostridioides difficile]MCA0574424.1 hypothetical protein [Clostridioides difficile]MDW0077018.1 hypothetical protein [Clostridioides difficile]PBG23756.1 hypothetical protein BGU81_18730 [Clostridioides difficile]